MDKEYIFRNLEKRYMPKCDIITRLPLGMEVDSAWTELLKRRKSRAVILPLNDHNGRPYWYVTTEKMVTASEKIVEALYEHDAENPDLDPFLAVTNVCTLEESFYTSFVEGSSMTMQDAMSFLQSGSAPRDMEEQLIINNRKAGSFAASGLFNRINGQFLEELAMILTEGLDEGAEGFRSSDRIDILSMQGENYELPQASEIRDKVAELEDFLGDTGIHPLIKAAVAQAWTLTVRPFAEGDERLGRILSLMILMRAGYSFLGEVSISGLIARRSYAYYEAIANILREENGSDLTYFIEYYLDMLARAVDERRQKKIRKQEEVLQTEAEMARAPLTMQTGIEITENDTGPDSPLPDTSSLERVMEMDFSDEGINGEEDHGGGPEYNPDTEEFHPEFYLKELILLLGYLIKEGITSFNISEVERYTGIERDKLMIGLNVMEQNQLISYIHGQGENQEYNILCDMESLRNQELAVCDPIECIEEELNKNNTVLSIAMVTLISWILDEKKTFFVNELANETGLSGSQFSTALRILYKNNIIYSMGPVRVSDNYYKYAKHYRILINKEMILKSGLYRRIYDQDILEAIDSLQNSPRSSKDRRVGHYLDKCLARKLITWDVYHENGMDMFWSRDMKLAYQMGITDRISTGAYRIRSRLSREGTVLNATQKDRLMKMYEHFGKSEFSKEMLIATLDYSRPIVSASLHEFTLLRILEYDESGSKNYRFRVSPEQNPEYFDTAV